MLGYNGIHLEQKGVKEVVEAKRKKNPLGKADFFGNEHIAMQTKHYQLSRQVSRDKMLCNAYLDCLEKKEHIRTAVYMVHRQCERRKKKWGSAGSKKRFFPKLFILYHEDASPQ